jgi:NADPH:quinone reductase-like Zn-dependent oxidoreductase
MGAGPDATGRVTGTTMKAVVLGSYCPPSQLRVTEVGVPGPAAGEVLVRVRATSVNPYDWHSFMGVPYAARLIPGGLGLRAPKIAVPGCDMAGQVEAVGGGVREFRPGDGVFALLQEGGFAEYACVREDLLARKPANLSYEQAAAVPMAAVTALVALREEGRIQPGQRVLINGASGGVGTFAVQLAAAFGASVTGVCSAKNADLVRPLGAEEVIDYQAEDFTRRGQRYDLIIDIAGSRPAAACRRVLTRKGTLVIVGGPNGRWLQPVTHAFGSLLLAPLVPQRITVAMVGQHPRPEQLLTTLTELIEAGKVTPVIDRHYPFTDISEAVSYQEKGHAAGKVVVTVRG